MPVPWKRVWIEMRNYPVIVALLAPLLLAVGLARDAYLIWHAPIPDPRCGGGTALFILFVYQLGFVH